MPPQRAPKKKQDTSPAIETTGNTPPRIRTRSSNSEKHPGRVDLDGTSDDDGTAPSQSTRRGKASKAKATSRKKEIDITAGMTREQKLALAAALQAELHKNDAPQDSISTLGQYKDRLVPREPSNHGE